MGKLYERLMSVFLDEARVKLDEMQGALESMSDGTDDREVRETLRRGAHTLKGNAAAMEFHPVARLAAAIEAAAMAVRDRTAVGAESIAVLRDALGHLAGLVERLAPKSLVAESVDERLLAQLEKVQSGRVLHSDGV